MLIDFSVENFRSFREKQTLSLLASPSQELESNLTEGPPPAERLVRVAAIYGPNASGKSNLLEAMNTLTQLLADPTSRSFAEKWTFQSFALDTESSKKPTRFEVRFVIGSIIYHYSISIIASVITGEQLTVYPSNRGQTWFTRERQEIALNRLYLKGPKEKLKDLTAEGVPFLAVAATFGNPQLTAPAAWIVANLRKWSANVASLKAREEVTRLCAASPDFLEWVGAFLRFADLGILRVEIESFDETVKRVRTRPAPAQLGLFDRVFEEEVVKKVAPYFIHSGADGFTARFPLESESHGTRRLYALLASFYAVLRGHEVRVAIIDEFGESLHPSLARQIIQLFQDPAQNPNGSQLVFSTHDSSLLNGRLFRRDQVWFTEKDSSGATKLYSLHDFKNVREDEAFEKGYLRGKYGAIPFFGSFDFPPVEGQAQTPADPRASLETGTP